MIGFSDADRDARALLIASADRDHQAWQTILASYGVTPCSEIGDLVWSLISLTADVIIGQAPGQPLEEVRAEAAAKMRLELQP